MDTRLVIDPFRVWNFSLMNSFLMLTGLARFIGFLQ